MPTQRLLADTIVSMGLMIALAIVGAQSAWPVLRAVADYAGFHELVLTDASDMFWLPFGFAVAFALPPLAGWLVALVHRGVTKSAPTLARFAVFVLVPAIAVALGILVQAWRMRGFVAEAAQSEIAPSWCPRRRATAAAASSARRSRSTR